MYTHAEPLFQRDLRLCELMMESEHLQTAIVLNGLAQLYYEQGKYVEAEPFRQYALHILELQGGETHPHQMVIALNGLAFVYAEQGKYAQAEPLYQRVRHIWAQHGGEMHPQAASMLNGLANLYSKQDKYAEAEPFYREHCVFRSSN